MPCGNTCDLYYTLEQLPTVEEQLLGSIRTGLAAHLEVGTVTLLHPTIERGNRESGREEKKGTMTVFFTWALEGTRGARSRKRKTDPAARPPPRRAESLRICNRGGIWDHLRNTMKIKWRRWEGSKNTSGGAAGSVEGSKSKRYCQRGR